MTKYPLTVERTRAGLAECLMLQRRRGARIAFVPTMGALHDGHLALIEQAGADADCVVASIFVNPTQFAPGEDFEQYPRDEAGDLAKLAQAGCHVAYCPSVAEMYPDGSLTHVRVETLSDLLDGRHRPHFFYGVTTIVARLFLHVQPDVAVFGEKDFQQLQIIRRMVTDLGFPITVRGGATRRDPDGLALSSRNAYLSPTERRLAGTLHAVLVRARTRLRIGTGLDEVIAEATGALAAAGFGPVDYVTVVDPQTLQSLGPDRATWPTEARLLAAAWLGRTRLIDNVAVMLTP